MGPEPTPRRPLLKAMAGGVVATGVIAAAVRLGDGDDGPGGAGPSLELSGDGASGVRALDVRLGDDLLPQVSGGRFRSRQLPTSTHSMVAFTWRGSAQPVISIKSRRAGSWTSWQRVGLLHDLPDLDSTERGAVSGTDLLFIGDSDGIQVHVGGGRPRDLTLVLLHPSRLAGDAVLEPQVSGRTAAGRTSARAGEPTVRRPAVLSRGTWGADESLRDGSPRFNETIKQVHVHHTVSTNTYAADEVAGLIRGMYRYHTTNLGWSDLGYNFLVDRFGRTWEGRAGGVARAVRGAHTLGFNDTSTGISVIGNFELVTPGRAIVDAVAALAAWKLDLYGRTGTGFTQVTSEGSDKYSAARTVKLPVIDGHRDTNDTACPGRYLYEALPAVRKRAQAIIERSRVVEEPVAVTTPARLTGTPAVGEVLAVEPGTYEPSTATATYAWARDGVLLEGVTTRTYTCTAADVGAVLAVRQDLDAPGRTTTGQVLTAPGPVTSPARLVVTPLGGVRGLITVRVRVQPPAGVDHEPTGQVTVTVKTRTKTVDVVDGVAVARFGRAMRFQPGRYRVTASHAGDPALRAPQVVTKVDVPRA